MACRIIRKCIIYYIPALTACSSYDTQNLVNRNFELSHNKGFH